MTDRRTFVRGILAAGGLLAMPDDLITELLAADPDPTATAAVVNRLRDAWPARGADILPDAERLIAPVAAAETRARDRGDVIRADALARVYADAAQWLSLAYLKAGEDQPQGAAQVWGERAETAAMRAGDPDLFALGACRRSVVHKHDLDRALGILVRARTARLDPWALVMVELHTATAYAASSSGRAERDALAAFERAGQALDATGRSPRPAWGDSLHHGWIDSYHGPKALLRWRPDAAERGLAEALEATLPTDHINRGAIAVRRAEAMLALGDLDHAAALGLLAWQELVQVDAGRDLARVRRLSATLSDRSGDGVVRELAEAVA